MRIATWLVLASVLTPLAATAQKRELLEMNRDIALLQEEVRNQKKANEDRFNAIDSALSKILDQINSANHQVATLDKGMKDRMDKGVLATVSGLGTKVDSLAEDFKYVRENVGEISEKLSKLQQQVVDLNNAVRTMQAPPAPPPAAPGGASPASSGPPAGVSADGLYKDALRDKSAGSYDLALEEFKKYLAWFGETDFAPNAQYYIGEIYFNQKNFDDAVQSFDAVIALPKNAKTLDARFMKGRALVRLGQKTDAAREFRAIVAASPGSDIARRAQAELRDLNAAPAKKRK
jgi:TolA-binding protein